MPKGIYKRRGKRYHRPDCNCASCRSKKGDSPFAGKHHNEKALEKMRGTRAPFSEEHKQQLRKPKSDLHKESNRFNRWNILSPGPDWFKTEKDFILLACKIYNLQYGVAHRRVKKVLKEKGLIKLDLLLYINYVSVGHNRVELSERFTISVEEVISRLKNFEIKFPGSFQSQVSAHKYAIGFIEWMEKIVKYQF